MTKLIVATRNRHKTQEIQRILGDAMVCLPMSAFPDVPTLAEEAATFAGNATSKAVQLSHWLATQDLSIFGLESKSTCVLADDSGLEVDALQGAPGVHSARFAAMASGASAATGNSPDAANNAKLLDLLRKVPARERSARFRCVLALTPVSTPQPRHSSPACTADATELQTELFEGACEGAIGFAPRGNGGFGYDPLFIPRGYDKSFAELGEEVKNRISHRARALEELRRRLQRSA